MAKVERDVNIVIALLRYDEKEWTPEHMKGEKHERPGTGPANSGRGTPTLSIIPDSAHNPGYGGTGGSGSESL